MASETGYQPVIIETGYQPVFSKAGYQAVVSEVGHQARCTFPWHEIADEDPIGHHSAWRRMFSIAQINFYFLCTLMTSESAFTQ